MFRKLLLLFLITILVGCNHFYEPDVIVVNQRPVRESTSQKVFSQDLWILQESNGAVVPFIDRAFTISMSGGDLYANNNIFRLGAIGDGYGDRIGSVSFYKDLLELNHQQEGLFAFYVDRINVNTIRLTEIDTGVFYVFTGYRLNHFNFDQLFFENLEFLLQEFQAWENTQTLNGVSNRFDQENYIQFQPNGVFRTSIDPNGLSIDRVLWKYTGTYQVETIPNNLEQKRLFLSYADGSRESFLIKVNQDYEVSLCHDQSRTDYVFTGRKNIIYNKQKGPKKQVSVLK